MSECVLITEVEYRKGKAVFSAERKLAVAPAPATERGLAAWVRKKSCRAVIVGVMPYTGALYKALGETGRKEGAILARFGVGHDGIDKAQTLRYGITVTNTPGVLDPSVAELTIWLMGGLARRVASLDAAFRGGSFGPARTGTELHAKTLAVIGLGPIGRRVAAAAHYGLGMEVVGVGRRSIRQLAREAGLTAREFKQELGLSRYTTDVAAALGQADVVSVHLPGTDETRGFFDAERLARIKPGALLINTSRGSVVDEAALYDSLAAGRLAGAALDVFANEPYKPAKARKDLRKLANVVLTPHIGSNTAEANARMARAGLENVRNFLAGNREDLTVVGR